MGKRSNTFKLSDLMPNSWFDKLKNMRSRGSRAQKAHNYSIDKTHIPRTEPLKSPTAQYYNTNRLSYYIPSSERAPEQLPLSHTNPKKLKKNPKKQLLSSSVLNSPPPHGIPQRRLNEGFDDEFIASASDFTSTEHNLLLPPVLTKPQPRLITGRKQSLKQGSRSPSGTQQIKLRVKSPKLVQKRVVKKKGLAESVVVVKSSSDPKRDFRESMVDMIFENKFFSCKELEELLACYLLLNSSEYHDLIVEVFEKVWFDLTEIIV